MDNDKKKKTILLVEDEAIISIATAKLVNRFGYNVVSANTGEKAVELAFTEGDINLILMDIDLGNGIDGIEAARLITENRDLPILFCTSHSSNEITERIGCIPHYRYIKKGTGSFTLQSSIETAFELFEIACGIDKIK